MQLTYLTIAWCEIGSRHSQVGSSNMLRTRKARCAHREKYRYADNPTRPIVGYNFVAAME